MPPFIDPDILPILNNPVDAPVGRALDCVAAQIAGWQRVQVQRGGIGWPPGETRFSIHDQAGVPAFSTDFLTAWSLLGVLRDRYDLLLTVRPYSTWLWGGWRVGVYWAQYPLELAYATGETEAQAICRAATEILVCHPHRTTLWGDARPWPALIPVLAAWTAPSPS